MHGCWCLRRQWLSKSVNHSWLGWPRSDTGEAVGIQRRDAECLWLDLSHSISVVYQELCWSAVTVRCINHLHAPSVHHMYVKGKNLCKIIHVHLVWNLHAYLVACVQAVGRLNGGFGVNRRLFCCNTRAVCCNGSLSCSKSDVCVVDAVLCWSAVRWK